MLPAGTSHAQKADDAATLNAEVVRLYQAGKYAEATEIAKRALALREKALGPNHADVATSLNNLAELYRVQGRYAEAEQLYHRSFAVWEKALGPEHPHVGSALNNLAQLYQAQGRYAEAEPLFARSLAIREKALGPEHPHVAQSLNNLAELYGVQGRYAEADPLLRRSLTISEKTLGPEHPDVATPLNNLARLYQAQGRYAEAEPLFARSLAIREKALGPEHPLFGTALNNLALLFLAQGRYAEGEPLLKRSLAISERALGPGHPGIAQSLNNLGGIYQAQGRYAEAEARYKRSLTIYEGVLGPEHPDVAQPLNNLAELYRAQGRTVEAEPLYRRTLAVLEKALGPEHPQVGTALNNLALLYQAQGRYAEAEPLHDRSLTIYKRVLGPDHPHVAQSLNNLAILYQAQGRYVEAVSLFKRSLILREKMLHPEHPDLAQSLNNLAELYRMLGRHKEAEPLFKRSLAILEKALGPEHPQVGTALNNMAGLALAQRDFLRAADFWRRSTSVVKRRIQHGLAGGDEASGGEAQKLAWQFWSLVRSTYYLAREDSAHAPAAVTEMFDAAQWALSSEAAGSLAQMAARSAKGAPDIAGLVRERQDLVAEWRAKDKLLIAVKSEPPANRKAEAEKALAERLIATNARLVAIDARLAKDFPDYAALASPKSVSIAEVQVDLRDNEALVLFLDTPAWHPLPEETFVWVVTKSVVRWVRSDLGTAALTREVMALRCGLDATAWDGDGAGRCAKVLGTPLDKAPGPNQPLPFDHARAHKLYSALFGEVQDLIKGKHLLIVPSGALTQLPFQVLVTKPPTSGGHRAAAWLAREHAVTALPAVSSLKALRRVGRPSAALRPMIGFGNPLLDGHAGLAKLARDKQRCPEAPRQRTAALDQPRAGVARVETRGSLADLSHLKAQVPLPETADELCDVARDVKADVTRDIRLGKQATEREIKRLSATGELAKYRMVHFATHGVLAGQLDGTHEPGLILTPPATATEEDDGYLSASEIAALKLDADWVVLSACNTAAGAATSAEALSGLARAFIYAQARALLVSHWEVYSDATVKLITTAVREMARDPKVGRAEALRRSMLALLDEGTPQEGASGVLGAVRGGGGGRGEEVAGPGPTSLAGLAAPCQ